MAAFFVGRAPTVLCDFRQIATMRPWPRFGCEMAKFAAGRDIDPFIFNGLDSDDGQETLAATGCLAPSNT